MISRWLKKINLRQVLTVFLAGVLLVISTACSNNALARTADQVEDEVPSSALTNKFEGGMNNYRDTDPRRDTKGADAKAEGLVRNSQRNLDKSVDGPGEYVQNVKEGASLEGPKKAGESLSEAASNTAEDFAEGTERGFKNLQKNASRAVDGIGDTVGDAADNASDTVERSADNVKKAAQKATGEMKTTRD
ncbi:hypothetical protein H6G20_26375 [Desertifilum sp. FACHB-1129]|uniref:CsbD-like domain-containing protein n=2 Tax=Desertifilum tharense IPPAS B-1220 TaxID=1781255 RepID=A0A1E5QHJ8_9CYAN|nr:MULTISPECIES: DUF6658 family protein [Desertifilum]MDA0211164.1 hypothetical protein [Cyanobacteria bacterium FC1]MBD2315197.1 hypothetical protein [Desertifilum sp. FACHB-1129]MBD2320066.1 hypothetical protein [Desertifilum sp. FACHB-866]MBD2330194.1 hypothetical protein [Desertifilum sp. FACHB-868]OEJ74088.1 hypothetical protein BH720_16480 [Desertifilum tharense IPPAS B-1220]